MVVRAIIKEDRYGNKVYVCPLCGHAFYSVKQFQRHLMKSHLYKRRRKARLAKKIEKRGYIRRIEFGKPKAPKMPEAVEEPESVAKEREEPLSEKPEDELMAKLREFVERRSKGRPRVRFKITTLARELGVDVEKARELVEGLENATIKGDRVTVKLE